jgi:hypothetical protein
MSRNAPRVYVDPVAIARLEGLAVQLPQDRRVEILLDDGSRLRGIVTMTPTLQSFFDADGSEGLNAFAKIECDSGENASLWVDRITRVERLPNPTPPEPSARTHPPDPNAPGF